MSDGPTGDRSGEATWVVDVTAPLAPGRVRVVAGEAAARLNLPAEKFVALLENRIGPVTKPLPEASARRVAEVLNLAGAEVAVRRAAATEPEPHELNTTGRESATAADEGVGIGEPSAERSNVSEASPTKQGESERTASNTNHATGEEPSEASSESSAVSPPPLGRDGRAAAHAKPDPWRGLTDDDDADEAMLGTWQRGASAAVAGEGSSVQQQQAPVKLADRPPATNDEVWADPEEDEDFEAWSYGMRDPFAEAERRERAVRRWVLLAALLIASTVFVALQVAYSRPGLDEREPVSYQRGLDAYRRGAFVTAARRWTPRAEAGDAGAMFMLGWMAEFGQGRPWSNAEAASWYRQSAERGHAPAQLRLADLYARGLGVPHDRATAARWYRAAAQAGLPRAQLEAALASAQEGRWSEARTYLEQAAQADADAAAWLGLLQASGTEYEGAP